MLNHYKKLIEYRKTLPVITEGTFTPLLEEHEKVFAYLRKAEDEQILVCSNFSAQSQTLELPPKLQNCRVEDLLHNYDKVDYLAKEITLKPYESFSVKLITDKA